MEFLRVLFTWIVKLIYLATVIAMPICIYPHQKIGWTIGFGFLALVNLAPICRYRMSWKAIVPILVCCVYYVEVIYSLSQPDMQSHMTNMMIGAIIGMVVVLGCAYNEIEKRTGAQNESQDQSEPNKVSSSSSDQTSPKSDASPQIVKEAVAYFCNIDDEHIFVYPNIPETKLNNAIESYAKSISSKDVFMLIDNTLWGGAREGMLLTPTVLYSKTSIGNPFQIAVKDIQHLNCQGKDIVINGTNIGSLVMLDEDVVEEFVERAVDWIAEKETKTAVAVVEKGLQQKQEETVRKNVKPHSTQEVPSSSKPADRNDIQSTPKTTEPSVIDSIPDSLVSDLKKDVDGLLVMSGQGPLKGPLKYEDFLAMRQNDFESQFKTEINQWDEDFLKVIDKRHDSLQKYFTSKRALKTLAQSGDENAQYVYALSCLQMGEDNAVGLKEILDLKVKRFPPAVYFYMRMMADEDLSLMESSSLADGAWERSKNVFFKLFKNTVSPYEALECISKIAEFGYPYCLVLTTAGFLAECTNQKDFDEFIQTRRRLFDSLTLRILLVSMVAEKFHKFLHEGLSSTAEEELLKNTAQSLQEQDMNLSYISSLISCDINKIKTELRKEGKQKKYYQFVFAFFNLIDTPLKAITQNAINELKASAEAGFSLSWALLAQYYFATMQIQKFCSVLKQLDEIQKSILPYSFEDKFLCSSIEKMKSCLAFFKDESNNEKVVEVAVSVVTGTIQPSSMEKLIAAYDNCEPSSVAVFSLIEYQADEFPLASQILKQQRKRLCEKKIELWF